MAMSLWYHFLVHLILLVHGALSTSLNHCGLLEVGLHLEIQANLVSDSAPIRCCPWWVSLSRRHGDKSMPIPTELLLCRLFLTVMYKHEVIDKTGST